MKLNPTSYYFLTGALLIGFFLFTGGITSDIQTAPPEIRSITVTPAIPTIFSPVEFRSEVIDWSFTQKMQGCGEKTRESPEELIGSITIMKGSEIIVDNAPFKYLGSSPNSQGYEVGTFIYSTSFIAAGNYSATAKFTSKWNGGNATDERTVAFTVSQGSEPAITTGKYDLHSILVTSSAYTQQYSVISPSAILGDSYFTITTNSRAALHMAVRIPASDLVAYPFLKSSYKYDANGKMIITKENEKYSLEIQYDTNVYGIFDFSYDGSILTVTNTDDNGVTYTLKFLKSTGSST